VAWMGGEVALDRRRLVRREHLERHGRPAPGDDQLLQDPGLQPVVIRVVVLFAEEHEARVGQTLDHRHRAHERRAPDVPDAADDRPGDRATRAEPWRSSEASTTTASRISWPRTSG